MDLFHPSHADAVNLETKAAGGGHGYVIDMLNGWRSHHKHHPQGPKATGILDWDAAKSRNEWNEAPGNTGSAKCYCYPKPQHAVAAIQAGFRLPVTLEILYPNHVWDWAQKEGHLEDRERGKVFPVDLVEKALRGETGDYQVDDQYKVYVTKQFKHGTKMAAANHVAGLPNEVFAESFAAVDQMLRQILTYLGFDQEDAVTTATHAPVALEVALPD